MTRRELLVRLDSRELSEWQAYASIEPFGAERMDMGFALVAMTMANLWKGKDQQPFELKDFMLAFGKEEEEPMSAEAMMQAFAMATGARR